VRSVAGAGARLLARGGSDEERRYSIAPALLDAVVNCLDTWRTLQELSGIVTPFTERLEQEIRAAVADEHRAELEEQKRASQAEITALREKTEAEIASKIRSRLLDLASPRGSGPPPSLPTGPSLRCGRASLLGPSSCRRARKRSARRQQRPQRCHQC